MKLCFITSNIYTMGGVQRVLSKVTNKLIEQYDIDIICVEVYKDEFKEYYQLDKKINVKYIGRCENKSRIKEKIYSKIKAINKRCKMLKNCSVINQEVYFSKEVRERVTELLNKEKYDVVVGVEGIYSLLVAMISNDLKAKTIGWYHNSYEAYFLTKNKYYWNMDGLFKKYIRNLDKLIVLTNSDRKNIKENMSIDSITIYNPLSFETVNKVTCNKHKILCVARLEMEQKGLDLLIDAFSKIAHKVPDWSLIIVGEGKDKKILQEKINEVKLQKRIIIKPHKDNIIDYYLDASLFVSSSRWEGFGLVITEAMECGLPVLAFDNTGPREILSENNTGILVERNNVKKLSEEMYNLITNNKKMKLLSKKSLERVEVFKVNKISSEWIKLINSIVD